MSCLHVCGVLAFSLAFWLNWSLTCELLAVSRYWSLRVTALFTFALTALALSGYAYFNENGILCRLLYFVQIALLFPFLLLVQVSLLL